MFGVLVVLFGWEDTSLPQCLMTGFPLAGEITDTGVYRVIEPRSSMTREDLLGQSAIDFIAELERYKRIHPEADRIAAETAAEIELGLAGPPRTKAQLDSTYGCGGWRPIPRHIIAQHNKWRPIDDGRRSSINGAAEMHENIVCQSGAFVAVAARTLLELLRASHGVFPFLVRLGGRSRRYVE
eukprot:5105111-Amphidinium_carterae.1